jgi:hypothetical protein
MEQLQYNTSSSDYMDAFSTARAAKNIFLIVLLVAILTQVAAFVAVQFFDVVDPLHATRSASDANDAVATGDANATPAAANAAPADANRPTTRPAVKAELVSETTYFIDELLTWGLPGAKFFALVMALLLCVTLLICLMLAVSERLGGVGMLTSSFFWSLVLLAIVTPWQQLLLGNVACGALYNKGELYSWVRSIKPSWGGHGDIYSKILFYARFLGYPVLGLLIWLVTQLKFARGLQEVRGAAPAERHERHGKPRDEDVDTPDMPLEDMQ